MTELLYEEGFELRDLNDAGWKVSELKEIKPYLTYLLTWRHLLTCC